MLFYFLCQNKFLIKTISLTKYTGILYRLIGIFYFKIDYNDINYFIKKTDPVGTTTNATTATTRSIVNSLKGRNRCLGSIVSDQS